jgi:hypothetical protein
MFHRKKEDWRKLGVLGPAVVGSDRRAGPALAVGVLADAGEEAVVCVLDDGEPGGGFGVTEPLFHSLADCL